MRLTQHKIHLYASALAFICIGLLPRCGALPVCTSDQECAPYVCTNQQCLPPTSPPTGDGSIKDGGDGGSESTKDNPTERSAPPEKPIDRPALETFVEVPPDERTPPRETISPELQEPGPDGGEVPESPREQTPEKEPVPETTPEVPEGPPELPPEAEQWKDFLRCGGAWIHPQRDPKHCGGCGRTCPQGEQCCNGSCGKGSPEVCNGMDDNCDGRIDEGLSKCVLTYAGLDLSLEGPAHWTPLSGPMGLALDKAGNLYIAERNRFRVRKLSPKGIITTIAGSGVYSIRGIGGTKVSPLSAEFQGPTKVQLDPAEKNLYIVQNVSASLWKLPLPGAADPRLSGTVHANSPLDIVFRTATTAFISFFVQNRVDAYDWINGTSVRFAGSGTGITNGPRLSSRFILPTGLALSPTGELHISDVRGHNIRKIGANDQVVTLAGTGFEGSTNGPGTRASFSEVRQMAFDLQKNLYVADAGNHQIRKITSSGQVSIFAGTTAGLKDDLFSAAQFFWPTGLVRDPQGNFYIADTGNGRIRKINTAGQVTTIAGASSFRNRPLHRIQLNEPMGLAFDKQGKLYVADAENQRVLAIDAQGNQSTVLGGGAQPLLRISHDNRQPGPQTAPLKHSWMPTDVAIDGQGNIAIAQHFDNRIIRIDSQGKAFIWGRLSPSTNLDGAPKVATLKGPRGLAYAQDGTLFVANTGANTLRMINVANNTMTTIAGITTPGLLDGAADKARFRGPVGLLVDDVRQRIYIADTGNHRIRMLDLATKQVTTFAGTTKGYKDDTADKAQFNAPTGLSWGPQGKDIYIADRDNHCIRKLVVNANGSAGAVTTYLGIRAPGKTGGLPNQSRFDRPTHLRWGPNQTLYISDTGNHLLRVYKP